jgi:hypothetical protein
MAQTVNLYPLEAAPISKSFLLLFFKNKVLPYLPSARATQSSNILAPNGFCNVISPDRL